MRGLRLTQLIDSIEREREDLRWRETSEKSGNYRAPHAKRHFTLPSPHMKESRNVSNTQLVLCHSLLKLCVCGCSVSSAHAEEHGV